MQNKSLPEKTPEHCVLCGKITPYFTDTPIKERDYYIQAAGQLCGECYAQTVLGDRKENALSDFEMLYLIEMCRGKA